VCDTALAALKAGAAGYLLKRTLRRELNTIRAVHEGRRHAADIAKQNANTYSIKDFVSRSNRFVIEAKYVRDKAHGKSIVGEINDDI
jgi:hypothetical protein